MARQIKDKEKNLKEAREAFDTKDEEYNFSGEL